MPIETKSIERVAYAALEPELRTGDVFLFHGDSRRSRIIEGVTRSDYSHIGMIVRPHPEKPPLLWHTDPRAVTEDLGDEERHGGAQLNDLTAALSVMTRPSYGDTPYARRLDVERTEAFEEAALRAIAAMDETSFPSLLRIVKEWVLGHLHVATSGRRMYCAEVLAATWQRMGLLPPEPPPNAYSPEDFSERHRALPLLAGATLGPEREVVWSPPDARPG